MAKTAKTDSRRTDIPEEIARFAALANEWWDETGPFKPLHALNPPRIQFIREHVGTLVGAEADSTQPFKGLRLLDIGCGGGLLAEPMSRLGFQVTAIDAAEASIEAARLHANDAGLAIDYRHVLPEDMAAALKGEEAAFDVVLNMEVIEHVADLDAFLAASAAMLKPGGATIVSTVNRTLKSLALAKVAAEYVLRWLPAGTHDWKKFVKPSELARGLRKQGITVGAVEGVVYNPLDGNWRRSKRDLDMNFQLFGVKDT